MLPKHLICNKLTFLIIYNDSHSIAKSSLRMSLLVGLFEFFNGVMRVNLRSRQIGMAQKLLDGIQIGSPIEQMRGVSVSQYVGALLGKCGDRREILFYRALNKDSVGRFKSVGQD